jgi:hypothetical protein
MRVVAMLELTAEIGEFVDGWNERGQHLAWTKAADDAGRSCPATDLTASLLRHAATAG